MNQPETQAGPPVECLVSFPGLSCWELPAVATNLDRRGAVVHLQTGMPWGERVGLEAAVEVLVDLPSHQGQPSRKMHCLGRVKHRSMDQCQRLWMVLKFIQIQFEASEEGPGSGAWNASEEEIQRGDRDPSIVEGSQPGESPQPFSLKQGEKTC
jgi:hypothetical protein